MKTYFIGLGGCGVKTLAEISKRLKKEDPNYEEDYAFTYIDTDGYTIDSINANEIIIPASDFVDMGPTAPLAIYNEALHTDRPNPDTERLLEWSISQEPGHVTYPNQPLRDGATAQRMVGRYGIYYYYNAVENELNRKISRFATLSTNDDGRRDVDIWVVASSCGGTGSSMILDILYMINRIGNPVAIGAPNVKLVLYMPQAFVALNNTNPNHKLNGYSCMEEINFFRSNFEDNKKQTFETFAVRPTKKGEPIIDFPLYQFLIPVCSENNVGSKMNVSQLYPTVAEMIYYLNTGEGKNFMKSNLSNILAELLQRSKDVPGVTSQMVGYGFRAIRKANKELKEYLEKRAKYEVVKFGLLDDKSLPNFDKLMKDFADTTILSKLITLQDLEVDDDKTNNRLKYYVDLSNRDDSLEAQVKKYVNNSIKYDQDNVNTDVIRSIDVKLERMLQGNDFDEIKRNIYVQIIKDIDAQLEEFILDYGLNNAYKLLNTVDDFYLEPLRRNIVANLLPNIGIKINTARSACKTYEKDGVRRREKANVNQCIKNYKETVACYIAMKITDEIIGKLTEAPSGYLEKLRKGDNKEMSGIGNLTKLLDVDCDDFMHEYGELAKKFRATSNDAMTVYLPSLSEIASGANNSDWAEDNFFDRLYQGSILEQQEIERGLEKTFEPVRKSNDKRGLKDILEKIDTDRNIFINVIKGKQIDIEHNKEKNIINPLKNIVANLAGSPGTVAGEWINQKLSDAINNPALLPNAFKKTADLFNSFKDMNRVPVFFPLRPGIQMPSTMRLMFVGDNGELAKSLGYDSKSKEQQFVEDKSMDDCFMVMRMPAGLEFGMYKHYPEYKIFYNSDFYNYKVRSCFYGCHIHKAFNEYGFNLPQMDNGVNMGGKGISTQLAEKRMEALVRTLFYQHVVDILYERDKVSYNKLFGITMVQNQNDLSELDAEQMQTLKDLGLLNESSAQDDSLPKPFISLDFDPQKLNIKLQMRSVIVNPKTNYIEVDHKNVQDYDFCKENSEKYVAFVDKLLTIPESLFSVADYMDNKFDVKNDENLNNALNLIKQDVKRRMSALFDENKKAKFALCMKFWDAHGTTAEKNSVKHIYEVINLL